jgi:hypothetical protein
MKFKFFLIALSFSFLSFSQYFPTYIGEFKPGIDFEQERDPIEDSYVFLNIELIENDIWLATSTDIYKVIIDENSNISFQNYMHPQNQISFFKGYKNFFLIKHLNEIIFYKVENGALIPVQKIKPKDNLEWILDNDKYFVIISGYVKSKTKTFTIYELQNENLNKICEYDITEEEFLFGLNNFDYLCYKAPSYLKDSILIRHLFDENSDKRVLRLEGAGGVIESIKIKGNYIYTIIKINDIERYFEIFEFTNDPTKAELKDKYYLNKNREAYFLLNEDCSKALIYEEDYYTILDISNPNNIIFNGYFKDEYNLFPYGNEKFIGNSLFFEFHNKLKYFTRRNSIYDPFTLKAEAKIPHFIVADSAKISGDNFLELFIKLKKFYLYTQNNEKNFTFVKEMPFPSCFDEVLPEEIPYYLDYLFDFEGSKIAFVYKDNLFIKSLEGKEVCLKLPYSIYKKDLDGLFIRDDKLFLNIYREEILIFDIKDLNNINLLVEYIKEEEGIMSVVNEKYLVHNYGIWNYSNGFICTDQIPPFNKDIDYAGSYSLEFVYENWVYYEYHLPFKNKSNEDFFILYEPFFVSEEGKWIDNLSLIYSDEIRFYSGCKNYAHKNEPFYFYTLDYRDPSRMRISDKRSLKFAKRNIICKENLALFETADGYKIYDPFGTNIPEELPFGWIDSPSQGEVIEGTSLNVFGWAVDANGDGIKEIVAYIDGTKEATLVYGLLREDVAEAKPGYPEALYSGFTGTLRSRGPGWHRLTIIAKDGKGNLGFIGIRDYYNK